MIRRRVSAALMALDAFTGQALGKRVMCVLDGVPLTRPVYKSDGWLILTDLSPGTHSLSLRCPGFEEKTLSLSGETALEETVLLSPGQGYAFPRGTVFLPLTLTGTAGTSARMFAGMSGARPLKLMKEADAGSVSVKLFVNGTPPRPGWFLVGRKTPEAVFLRRVSADGDADAAEPLTQTRSRGDTLIPVQSLRVTAGTSVKIPFRGTGTAYLFCRGTLRTIELRTDAEARLEWTLEE